MIKTSFVVATLCCIFFIVFQTILTTATASKRTGLDEFMLRDQKIRKRQNRYHEETALDNILFENDDDSGPSSKFFEQDDTTEKLPSLIVDYANMIRNDYILLDNSVKLSRTRKRDNIIVEKRNQAIPDVPCSCEISNEMQDLGTNTYPRFIVNRTCSENKCKRPYICKPTIYNLIILKRRTGAILKDDKEIPSDISRRWFAEESPVIAGCVCTKDYIIPNK